MCILVYLDKHLAHWRTIVGGAVDRHGLPVSGELQGELFPHQLLDHLIRHQDRQSEKNLLSGSGGNLQCVQVREQMPLTELQALALSILDRLRTSVSKTFIFSTRQVRAVSVASPTFSYTPFTWNIKKRLKYLLSVQQTLHSTPKQSVLLLIPALIWPDRHDLF